MEKDDSESIIEKYQARMQSMNIPVPIREVIDEEMNKLRYEWYKSSSSAS